MIKVFRVALKALPRVKVPDALFMLIFEKISALFVVIVLDPEPIRLVVPPNCQLVSAANVKSPLMFIVALPTVVPKKTLLPVTVREKHS